MGTPAREGGKLSRAEMKNIMAGSGGEGGCPLFNYQCSGTGTWSGHYCSTAEIANDILAYCANGGTCTQI